MSGRDRVCAEVLCLDRFAVVGKLGDDGFYLGFFDLVSVGPSRWRRFFPPVVILAAAHGAVLYVQQALHSSFPGQHSSNGYHNTLKEGKVNDLVKTLLTSSLAAGLVSWAATSYKIEQELHSKQGEAGYEALIKANVLLWQSENLMWEAEKEKNEELANEARKLKRQSDGSYYEAQHKIAAFGDDSVVKAMGRYYVEHLGAKTPCADKEKFRADAKTYKAIRTTLGVGGRVTDQEVATLLFKCSLK